MISRSRFRIVANSTYKIAWRADFSAYRVNSKKIAKPSTFDRKQAGLFLQNDSIPEEPKRVFEAIPGTIPLCEVILFLRLISKYFFQHLLP
jgi:hypothetical protein